MIELKPIDFLRGKCIRTSRGTSIDFDLPSIESDVTHLTDSDIDFYWNRWNQRYLWKQRQKQLLTKIINNE